MEEGNLICSITYRCSVETQQSIQALVGRGKMFKNLPEASRVLVKAGLAFLELQSLTNNPEKKAELEKKYENVLFSKNIEQTLDSMNVEELDILMMRLSTLKDSKLKQLLLSMK